MPTHWFMRCLRDVESSSAYKHEPGIYVIRRSEPVPRLLDTDSLGTLYIGKATYLRSRLRGFYHAQGHSGGMSLWRVPREPFEYTARVTGALGTSETETYASVGALQVRAAYVPYGELDLREQACMWVYREVFGETPPLNSSIPGRWNTPRPRCLEWARKGLAT
jgi:hypothetical protein